MQPVGSLYCVRHQTYSLLQSLTKPFISSRYSMNSWKEKRNAFVQIWLSCLVVYLWTATCDGGRIKRIVGGNRTEIIRFPWQVFLELTYKDGSESRCGGSIISDRHVLTAAHCLHDECYDTVRKVRILIGAYDVCEDDWAMTRVVRSQQVFIHPGYNPRTYDHDVAVLLLRQPITFGPKVQSVNLPSDEAVRDCQVDAGFTDYLTQERITCDTSDEGEEEEETTEYEDEDEDEDEDDDEDDDEDEDEEDYDETEDFDNSPDAYTNLIKTNCTTYYDLRWASVAGWGKTSRFDGSCVLRQATTQLLPNNDQLCREDGAPLDKNKLCAYNDNDSKSDSCQGDSGSGLVVNMGRSGTVLVGIVSYGDGCGHEDSPGKYSRVQYFTPWVRQIMRINQ